MKLKAYCCNAAAPCLIAWELKAKNTIRAIKILRELKSSIYVIRKLFLVEPNRNVSLKEQDSNASKVNHLSLSLKLKCFLISTISRNRNSTLPVPIPISPPSHFKTTARRPVKHPSHRPSTSLHAGLAITPGNRSTYVTATDCPVLLSLSLSRSLPHSDAHFQYVYTYI